MASEVRIGAAAAELGVAAHVLRHWEDVGVLVARRSSSRHRVYDEESLTRGRLVLLCQRAGLSLAEIRELSAVEREDRIALIARRRAEIAETLSRLRRADAFLAHVLQCRHEIVTQCPDCVALAR